MMNKSQLMLNARGRKNERGAALLMSLLVATALLAAGGALILTTATTAKTAINSTSEMQAYYAAEAGLQAALNALRGNAAPTATAMLAPMTGVTLAPLFQYANTRFTRNSECHSHYAVQHCGFSPRRHSGGPA
jgi:type II secretory pathway component PulK